MTSETYLDLTFERNTKNMSGSGGGGGGGHNSGASGVPGVSVNVPSNAAAGAGVGGSEKRPIRPKLLKLSDVTIPHRNRKKTKTKGVDDSWWLVWRKFAIKSFL
ncbi:hypothetical protein CVS40_11012 [Lucilia cuprina]|nr:hypothetical protein CVS40_11012 [Lucilia cuprina]